MGCPIREMQKRLFVEVARVGRPCSGGLLEALRELGDCGSAATRCSLYGAPGLAGADHPADAVIALQVLCTTLVAPLGLGFCLALGLAPAPIDVVFAGDGGQHIPKHSINGVTHPGGELVSGL